MNVFDLTLLRTRLLKIARFKPLAGLIHSAQSYESAAHDLRTALECLDILRLGGPVEISEVKGLAATRVKGEVRAALMMRAVFLYTRTVDSQFNRRNTNGLLKGLSVAQRAAHDTIREIRNSAFAHFGHEATFSSPWNKEALIISIFDVESYYSLAYSRQNVQNDAAVKLAEVVSVVLANAEALRLRAIDLLHNEYDKQCDKELLSLTRQCVFDEAKFYGGDPDSLRTFEARQRESEEANARAKSIQT